MSKPDRSNRTGVVTLNIEGPIAEVTLARPDARNRLSSAALDALLEICTELRDDVGVRVVIVQGAGRDFSTGVDLKDPALAEVARQPLGQRRRSLLVGPRVVEAVQALPQITIAAMHGYCLGGGGCVALACDLRVAADDLQFGMPEAQRGMNMSWHSVPLMVAHFGPARTKELLVTGKLLDSATAVSWGLANRRSAAGPLAVQAEARSWAEHLVRTTPPIAATMIKETVNAVANAHSGTVHMDTDQFILSQSSEDFREAVAAFIEKREPRYEGK